MGVCVMHTCLYMAVNRSTCVGVCVIHVCLYMAL